MLLYFIPAASSSISLAELRRAGLGYAFESAELVKRAVTRGPGGAPGQIVAAGCAGEVGYFPERQTWRKIPWGVDRGACANSPHAARPTPHDPPASPWVGYFTAAAPTPDWLARAKQLSGHEVTLLDGNRWLAPIARGWTEEDGELRWFHTLPRRCDLDEEGRWTQDRVLDRYRPLWDLALRWDEARMAALRSPESRVQSPEPEPGADVLQVRFDFEDILAAAVAALQANYRIGPTEVALLGLLTQELAVDVLDALADFPTRLDWLKKKLPPAATDSSSPGPEGSTAATAPP
ncbi:MAG: hypothetical protein ABSG68_11385 [Thermoguttaceae bacterium]|jgi:hypothetical protein